MSTKRIPDTLRDRMSRAGKRSWEVRRQRAEAEEAAAAARAAERPAVPEPTPIVIAEIPCPKCSEPAVVLATGPDGTARIGDRAVCGNGKLCGAEGHVIETETGEAGVKWD